MDMGMNAVAAESPQKVFGAMLGYFRANAGLTPEQLGTLVFLSGSQIRKVEAGARSPSDDLVKACEDLPELHCNGALTKLHEILGEALKKNAFYPGWFAGWPDKEAAARRLRSFSLVVIDGLLQTEDYARAILRPRVGGTPEELDKAVKGRLVRQRILDREHPPELWAIIDEGALRRTVGSPEIMREQLRHLVEMARKPHIVVQVIPLESGAHDGLNGGPFIVADFDNAPIVAYQDTALRGQIIEDTDEAEELLHTWDTLGLDALPRAASLKMLEELAA